MLCILLNKFSNLYNHLQINFSISISISPNIASCEIFPKMKLMRSTKKIIRRYSPLNGKTSSSSKELCPLGKVILSFIQLCFVFLLCSKVTVERKIYIWEESARMSKRYKCGIFSLYSLSFLDHLQFCCFDENYHVL